MFRINEISLDQNSYSDGYRLLGMLNFGEKYGHRIMVNSNRNWNFTQLGNW